MTNNEHDALAELLGVYALDAVEPHERAMIESHLPICPRCRAELDDHLEVVALLANTGSDAPAGVWNKIESALIEVAPAFDLDLGDRVVSLGDRRSDDPVVVDEPDRGGATVVPFAKRRIPVLLTAAAASVALIVGVAVGTLASGDDTAPTVEVATSIDEAARAAFNRDDATRVPLGATDGDLQVDAVIADGQGFLIGSSLPALNETQAYQLWGVRQGVAVSLGVLGNAPSVVAFPVTADFEVLAITVEPAGGVVSSAQAPAFVGEVA